LRGDRAQNGLFYEFVHAVFAADFLFGQRGFEQGVVLRQGVAFGFVMPKVVGDAGEFVPEENDEPQRRKDIGHGDADEDGDDGVLAGAHEGAAVLRPVLATTYQRTTLHLPRAEARATIDTALTWQRLGPAPFTGASAATSPGTPTGPQALRPSHLAEAINDGEPVAVADIAVVETKNPATPSPADRALWDAGHRPTRISKYATGMALLHPELPANKWYRTLTHELADLFGTDRSSLESISTGHSSSHPLTNTAVSAA